MPRRLVGVNFNINPDLLDCINRDIHGKNQSEKLRLCVAEGYNVLKK